MIDWIEMGRKTVDMHCEAWQDIAKFYGLYIEEEEMKYEKI